MEGLGEGLRLVVGAGDFVLPKVGNAEAVAAAEGAGVSSFLPFLPFFPFFLPFLPLLLDFELDAGSSSALVSFDSSSSSLDIGIDLCFFPLLFLPLLLTEEGWFAVGVGAIVADGDELLALDS